jgi:hypothetical protein
MKTANNIVMRDYSGKFLEKTNKYVGQGLGQSSPTVFSTNFAKRLKEEESRMAADDSSDSSSMMDNILSFIRGKKDQNPFGDSFIFILVALIAGLQVYLDRRH